MFQRHEKILKGCMERIKSSSVLVAGVGGLGSTVSTLLVRLGFGEIHMVDSGIVDEPDLNRQILYDRSDLGREKVLVAKEKLSRINPNALIVPHLERIDESFDLPRVDVVVDCLDNFKSRFILEGKAWDAGVPLVHAGVKEFYAQITVIERERTKRLEDIFGRVEDTNEKFQVFPPIVTLTASIQVDQVVKIICEGDGVLRNTLLIVDILNLSFERIQLV